MDLRTYLFLHRIKQKEFAKELGLPQPFISMICNGKRVPKKSIKKLIEYHTRGVVKIDDWPKKSSDK